MVCYAVACSLRDNLVLHLAHWTKFQAFAACCGVLRHFYPGLSRCFLVMLKGITNRFCAVGKKPAKGVGQCQAPERRLVKGGLVLPAPGTQKPQLLVVQSILPTSGHCCCY